PDECEAAALTVPERGRLLRARKASSDGTNRLRFAYLNCGHATVSNIRPSSVVAVRILDLRPYRHRRRCPEADCTGQPLAGQASTDGGDRRNLLLALSAHCHAHHPGRHIRGSLGWRPAAAPWGPVAGTALLPLRRDHRRDRVRDERLRDRRLDRALGGPRLQHLVSLLSRPRLAPAPAR